MPLYRYVHRKNILADGTMSRMPRKRDLGTRLGRVRFVFFYSDETSFTVVCAAFRCLFSYTGLRYLILLSQFKFSRVNLTFLRTISCEEVCEKY